MTTATFSAIDVFAAVRRGQPSPGITEPRRIGCEHGNTPAGTATSGHAAAHGGLRGHSIDADTYPFRIVFCGGWEIHDATGRVCRHYGDDADSCELAHRFARYLKARYPDGRLA